MNLYYLTKFSLYLTFTVHYRYTEIVDARSCAGTAKNCTKQRDRAELMFC